MKGSCDGHTHTHSEYICGRLACPFLDICICPLVDCVEISASIMCGRVLVHNCGRGNVCCVPPSLVFNHLFSEACFEQQRFENIELAPQFLILGTIELILFGQLCDSSFCFARTHLGLFARFAHGNIVSFASLLVLVAAFI